jgi:hypothetical protein
MTGGRFAATGSFLERRVPMNASTVIAIRSIFAVVLEIIGLLRK